MRRRLYIISLMVFCFLFVFLDQITKYIAVDKLMNKESYVLIKNFFSFTYVENRGAAWGVLSGKLNILVITTLIVIPILIYVIIKIEIVKKKTNKLFVFNLFQFNLILLLAGAIGNFIDRVINGYVVDFLQFTFIDFPVFNVADCYITVGTILFAILYLFFIKDEDFTLIFKKEKNIKGENTDVN